MWKNVTVEQFIKIKSLDVADEDHGVKCLSILTGQSTEYLLEKIHYKALRHQLKDVAFVHTPVPVGKKPKKVIWLNGTRYVANLNPGEYTNNVYLSLLQYRKDGTLKNLDKILGWIYKPTFAREIEPDKYAKDFLKAKITDVYGCFFLWTRQLARLKVVTSVYEATAMEMLAEHLQVITRFSPSTMAGSTLST